MLSPRSSARDAATPGLASPRGTTASGPRHARPGAHPGQVVERDLPGSTRTVRAPGRAGNVAAAGHSRQSSLRMHASPTLTLVGHVESPLADLAAAPRQGDEGAPD